MAHIPTRLTPSPSSALMSAWLGKVVEKHCKHKSHKSQFHGLLPFSELMYLGKPFTASPNLTVMVLDDGRLRYIRKCLDTHRLPGW